MRKTILILVATLLISPVQAQSILEIPRGTIFSLNYELEAPANRNFIVLGENRLEASFNQLNQFYNVENGRNYNFQGAYNYDRYLDLWYNTAEQSYRLCLERHRRIGPLNYGNADSNVIVSQGNGNTNVIVSNNSQFDQEYFSYIEYNTCISPDYTISLLLLDTDAVGSGGIFRQGYEFEVSGVSHNRRGRFHEFTIWFDHEVARGIRVVTTNNPENVSISQLHSNLGSTGGFWNTVGEVFAQSVQIGGNYFSVSLPALKYFK